MRRGAKERKKKKKKEKKRKKKNRCLTREREKRCAGFPTEFVADGILIGVFAQSGKVVHLLRARQHVGHRGGQRHQQKHPRGFHGPRTLVAATPPRRRKMYAKSKKSNLWFVGQKLCQLAVENLAEKTLLGQHLFRVSLAGSRAKLENHSLNARFQVAQELGCAESERL